MRSVFKFIVCVAVILVGSTRIGRADVVHQDDTIVKGSLGVGLDTSNGENFGFDTIRLKENNVRIAFVDTSSSSSFPTVDWSIVINDSANGGDNHFSIQNNDAGTMPFRIFHRAPANALVVDAQGDIGVGNLNPVVELHITDGDSPTMRLEQDGSSGFNSQTWDVAGNETNFFVRDVTNGSLLPFKIRPSAPANSLYVDTDGDIGLGTATPTAQLHVVGDGLFTTNLEVQGNGSITGNLGVQGNGSVTGTMGVGTTTPSTTFHVVGNGRFTTGGLFEGLTTVSLGSSDVATVNANADELVIEDDDHAGISILTPSNKTGNLFFGDTSDASKGGLTYTRGPFPGTDSLKLRVGATDSWTFQDSGGVNSETGAFLSSGGVWTDASSRDLKKDIADLSLEKALETVIALKPVEFTYKGELGDRKVGFIAEDVPDLVATPSRKGLSAMDIVGVLTKVVQQQQQEVETQKTLINELNQRLRNLEKKQN
jgi:hypothetical protein